MHKQLVNEAVLDIALNADGPLLIKAGDSGLDPTRPDMEFVRTLVQGNPTVFLPGSSLKGAIRAHAERIVRSLQTENSGGQGACDPLKSGSCSDRLERERIESDEKYARSCFICRLFGNTSVAGRLSFTDALPEGEPPRIEARNGVAIDRVYGSVAVGPFNYEVVTEGRFRSKILLKNFTLSQLALIGLALRDLDAGRLSLGFAKSRGLGRVRVAWLGLEIRYPLAAFKPTWDQSQLHGVGALVKEAGYQFPTKDSIPLPASVTLEDDEWGTLQLKTGEEEDIHRLFRALVSHWREEVIGE